MYGLYETLNDSKKVLYVKPCGKVMNLEVESRNGILLIMNDGLKFDLLE